ncbi:MAG: hypothetical protein ACI9Y1_001092 [Lentisphaeria bacterium]|jgi:hypothetical protein
MVLYVVLFKEKDTIYGDKFSIERILYGFARGSHLSLNLRAVVILRCIL